MPVLFFRIHSPGSYAADRISMRLRPLLFLLLGLAPVMAGADTLYKCVDEHGRTMYTNQKSVGRNCTVMSQDKPVSTFSAPPARARPAAPSPEGFPKVSGETQKSRDSDRRRILEDELANERRALDEARRALAEQEAIREGGERNYQRVLDRLKPYQDKVQLHERNIEALQKELANLR